MALQIAQADMGLLGRYGTNAKELAVLLEQQRQSREQQRQGAQNTAGQAMLANLEAKKFQAEQDAANSPAARAMAQEQARGAALKNLQLEQSIGFNERSNPLKLGQQAATLDTTIDSNTIRKLEFMSNRYGNIKSPEALARVNNMAMKLGLFTEDQLPQDVGTARLYYEGSKLHQFDMQQAAKQQEWDRRLADREDKQNYDMAMTVMQARQKQAYAMQLERERNKLGLARDVEVAQFNSNKRKEEMAYAGKVMPADMARQTIAQKAGMVSAPVQPARNAQGQLFDPRTGEIIEERAMGGPIEENKPYLVGEQGPEIIVPQQSGQVIPNNQTQQVLAQNDQSQQIMDMVPDPATNPPPMDDFNQRSIDRADALLNKSFDQAMNPQQMVPSDAKGKSESPLGTASRTEVEKDLNADTEKLTTLGTLLNNFDESAFEYSSQAANYGRSLASKVGIPVNEEKVQRFTNQVQNIQQLKLAYQKEITGVAGSDKTMEEIAKSTLTPNQSPAEAKATMARMVLGTLHARKVRLELLRDGYQPGTRQYSDRFLKLHSIMQNAYQQEAMERLRVARERGIMSPRNPNKPYDILDATNGVVRKLQKAEQPAPQE